MSDPLKLVDPEHVKASRIRTFDIATEAAARLNLTRGRDNKWRGRCPACGYAKPTLEVAVEQDRIAISCSACGGPCRHRCHDGCRRATSL